jgi:hypothetical protein
LADRHSQSLLCTVSGDKPSLPGLGAFEREENIAILAIPPNKQFQKRGPTRDWCLGGRRIDGRKRRRASLLSEATRAIVPTILADAKLDSRFSLEKWEESTPLGLVIRVWSVSTAAAPLVETTQV